MISFLLGMVATIAIIAFGGFCYMLGHKSQPKPTQRVETESMKREREAIKKTNEDLNKLLNYDISMAFKSRNGGIK